MEKRNHLEPWQMLNNKVVMVTGASSGLGQEMSLDLAKAGCRLILAARRVQRLKSLCDDINNNNNKNVSKLGTNSAMSFQLRAVAVELDITADGKVIEAAVLKAWDAFGHIDALVNNAGVRGSVHSPFSLSEKEFDDTFRTNMRGTWLVSKYIGIHMRNAKQGGCIINISSVAGLNRVQVLGALAYASSKVAVNTMTNVMALELGVHNIRVNSISPGLFKSEITESLMNKDWLKNVAQKIIPLKTFGTSDPALTSLVRYLIHVSSDYVSGNVFIVDAGDTLTGVPIFSSL